MPNVSWTDPTHSQTGWDTALNTVLDTFGNAINATVGTATPLALGATSAGTQTGPAAAVDHVHPPTTRISSVSAPGGDSTLILQGVLPPTVAAANITASSDDQAAGPLVKYLTSAASTIDAGVISTFGVIQPQWAPYLYARIRTDASAITSTRLAVGIVSADVASNAGPASTGAYTTASGAWFRYDTGVDGTAFWRTVTSNGTTATVTTTNAALAADTDYELTMPVI